MGRANQLLSFAFKLALLAFFMLTMAGPTLGRLQPTTETNPEVVMKAFVQELGKEQLAAYYMQEIMAVKEPKLAMVVKSSSDCSRKFALCRQSLDCCEGLTCKRIKYRLHCQWDGTKVVSKVDDVVA